MADSNEPRELPANHDRDQTPTVTDALVPAEVTSQNFAQMSLRLKGMIPYRMEPTINGPHPLSQYMDFGHDFSDDLFIMQKPNSPFNKFGGILATLEFGSTSWRKYTNAPKTQTFWIHDIWKHVAPHWEQCRNIVEGDNFYCTLSFHL
jgi:hypothetical protein